MAPQDARCWGHYRGTFLVRTYLTDGRRLSEELSFLFFVLVERVGPHFSARLPFLSLLRSPIALLF